MGEEKTKSKKEKKTRTVVHRRLHIWWDKYPGCAGKELSSNAKERFHRYHQLHHRTAGSTKVRMPCKLGTAGTAEHERVGAVGDEQCILSTLLHIPGIVHRVRTHTLHICWLILVSVARPRSADLNQPLRGCAAADRSRDCAAESDRWCARTFTFMCMHMLLCSSRRVLPGDSEDSRL